MSIRRKISDILTGNFEFPCFSNTNSPAINENDDYVLIRKIYPQRSQRGLHQQQTNVSVSRPCRINPNLHAQKMAKESKLIEYIQGEIDIICFSPTFKEISYTSFGSSAEGLMPIVADDGDEGNVITKNINQNYSNLKTSTHYRNNMTNDSNKYSGPEHQHLAQQSQDHYSAVINHLKPTRLAPKLPSTPEIPVYNESPNAHHTQSHDDAMSVSQVIRRNHTSNLSNHRQSSVNHDQHIYLDCSHIPSCTTCAAIQNHVRYANNFSTKDCSPCECCNSHRTIVNIASTAKCLFHQNTPINQNISPLHINQMQYLKPCDVDIYRERPLCLNVETTNGYAMRRRRTTAISGFSDASRLSSPNINSLKSQVLKTWSHQDDRDYQTPLVCILDSNDLKSLERPSSDSAGLSIEEAERIKRRIKLQKLIRSVNAGIDQDSIE